MKRNADGIDACITSRARFPQIQGSNDIAQKNISRVIQSKTNTSTVNN